MESNAGTSAFTLVNIGHFDNWKIGNLGLKTLSENINQEKCTDLTCKLHTDIISVIELKCRFKYSGTFELAFLVSLLGQYIAPAVKRLSIFC